MKKTTYKGIAANRLYSVKEVMSLLNCSRVFIFIHVTDATDPLRYVIDKNTNTMRFEGSELIRRFKIKKGN